MNTSDSLGLLETQGLVTVETLGGKLILSDVNARPHAELAAWLPT